MKGFPPIHYHEKGDFPNNVDGLSKQETEQETGWYFWDETWADREGPFKTEYEAIDAYIKYSVALACNCMVMGD